MIYEIQIKTSNDLFNCKLKVHDLICLKKHCERIY